MPHPLRKTLRAGLLVCATLLIACTPQPTAELNAYARTFEAFEDVSNDILTLITPYERAGTRQRRYTAANCPDDQPSVLVDDPFCYGIRDAFATIGDPPLVKSYRNLITIVARFNAIVVAYAEGASFRFVQQDMDEFSNSVSVLGTTASSEFASLVGELTPVAERSLTLRDRQELQAFIAENVPVVEMAFDQMVLQSGALFSNVDSGTQYLIGVGAGNTSALRSRRGEIRDIIANWTVLTDQTRDLLQGMEFAITNPENLEVRLRNLGAASFEVSKDFDVLRGQISNIGTAGAFE